MDATREVLSPDGIGLSPDKPLPTLNWPSADKPKSWWGRNTNGELTKVYRDYAAYCDD